MAERTDGLGVGRDFMVLHSGSSSARERPTGRRRSAVSPPGRGDFRADLNQGWIGVASGLPRFRWD